jgi:hypothetical protein
LITPIKKIDQSVSIGKKGMVKIKRPAADQIEIKFDSKKMDSNISSVDKEETKATTASKIIYHDFRTDIYKSILNRKMQ